MNTCEPYPGIIVQTTFSPVALEIDIVRRGGKFKNRAGKMCGNGLYYHFKKGCSLIWPDIVWHRWNELVLKEWLEHKYVGVMGAANSGKTNTMAFAHLFDYYCFPYSTTTIVCSTTERDLENRIWGEMKRLHRDAITRWDYLPGHLIEGKLRIVTDDRSEAAEGRDFRMGLMGVPTKKGTSYVGISSLVGLKAKRLRICGDELCFPAGTPVDTPSGPVPIETLAPGDSVISAMGESPVVANSIGYSNQLVRVKFRDGTEIVCTPNHPFFTLHGWEKACHLNEGSFILSTHEAMLLLRSSFQTGTLPEALQSLPSPDLCLPILSSEISVARADSRRLFLQSILSNEVDARIHGSNRASCQNVCIKKAVFESQPGLYGQDGQSLSGLSLVVRCSPAAFGHNESEGHKAYDTRRKRNGSNQARVGPPKPIPGSYLESRHQNGQMEREWLSTDLQSGPGICKDTLGNRMRWVYPQQSASSGKGREENRVFKGAWVESVEVLQHDDPEFSPDSCGCYQIYNLRVGDHPSFSVKGLLVHNSLLPKAWIDSLSNLMKGTPGYTDRKASGIGNPADTLDALGLLCEPAAHLGGWDGGIDQTPVTKVWETRWPDGVCVQLCGSDSPNMVAPKGAAPPYPFLITRDNMEDDAKVWGIDDWHYKMFDDAMMPRGQGSRRVITRQQCLKFHALDEPLWLNANRTRICFLDAAYRGVGGDRCVFGTLEFGAESVPAELLGTHIAQSFINQTPDKEKNRIILALIDLVIIPIVQGTGEPAEDQIVAFVQSACEERHVPQTHFYYDAGMRTSLVQAFARHNWNQCNSIDCGGKPTEDQVSADIDVSCRDYYSKFVTQLWFDVRYIIEANQFRGMTQDVMLEFCAREWKRVGSNKIEVESKEELKKKTGRSPDLADALAIGVFGARQKGFVIKRLGNARRDKKDNAWERRLKEQAREIYASSQLIHTV